MHPKGMIQRTPTKFIVRTAIGMPVKTRLDILERDHLGRSGRYLNGKKQNIQGATPLRRGLV
jgi:hypothetical protein